MTRGSGPADLASPAQESAGRSRSLNPDGLLTRRRVVIEHMQPQVDGGRFPIKRTPGDSVTVTADIFADGHDQLAGVLKYRHVHHPTGCDGSSDAPDTTAPGEWCEVPLVAGDNDTWAASFTVTALGEYEYTVEAWVDHFRSWHCRLAAKAAAAQDVTSELLEGAEMLQRAATSHVGAGSRPDEELQLVEIADVLRSNQPQAARVAAACNPELRRLMDARPDRTVSTMASPSLRATVDPERARFGAWYEMFPRSCTTDPGRPGTLREAEARLPEIAAMGFDVLYLPPIHPIGRTGRKGRNNALVAAAGDPGSPWAIGSDAGGHTAIDPALGTLEDFERFVGAAGRLGLEIALDIAFQASPDPWVQEHPEWFRHGPDGSIKYAENPPKKYQDIYPFDFESRDVAALWEALRDVLLFWISHGVKIFRVDNPHTKPLAFWEWVTGDVRRRHPDVVFLSEAFTRPKPMRYLAKAGFSQSYTYFTWRNTARELQDYLTELTRTELQEYMRPNFFANTPDILHAYLQTGGRAAFEVRLILAATLSASYGIYSGFELCENVPLRPGSEEYLNSEKYEIRPRDWHKGGNLNELIARVNQIRRDRPALQRNETLAFHATENPAMLWFSKPQPAALSAPAVSGDCVFVVVNTDPHWMQHGRVQVPLAELGVAPGQSFLVHELLDGTRYLWQGDWN